MLELFKSLPTVHAVARLEAEAAASPATAGYVRQAITMDWQERLKARGRRRTDAGVEFGTALPRGTVLRAGDALVLDVLQLVAIVVERPEPVCVVTPASAVEWGLYGYLLGNSHQPIMLTAREIVCLDDLGMCQILEQHAIPFRRETRPFTPLAVLVDHRHQGGPLSLPDSGSPK